jgi:hypothetical protein
MTVNKFKILKPKNSDKEITIPVEMNWDFLDRSNDIVEFERKTIKEVINEDKDFEVARFAHANNPQSTTTDINYNFYFAPTGSSTTNTFWDTSYTVQGFTPKEVYYFANSFKKSFFKLDLYDSTNQKSQVNYITLIIPTQQGLTSATTVGYKTENIKKPSFKLDFIGADKEGFFIYWLKKRDFLNIDTFYMTAKFFDGKNGEFIKMMNTQQSTLGTNKFNFNQEDYYYYKIKLDYTDYTYKVYDVMTGNEVGSETQPINWYEYLNP